jgi:Mn2+/Fe2+ NRAMP family transporter
VVVVVLLASNKAVMGTFTASRTMRALGWLTAAIMGVAAVSMFVLRI